MSLFVEICVLQRVTSYTTDGIVSDVSSFYFYIALLIRHVLNVHVVGPATKIDRAYVYVDTTLNTSFVSLVG
jgi:hypothetical protein